MHNLANVEVMDTRFEYFNVLSNVRKLSLQAQDAISTQLQNEPNNTSLHRLKAAFNDLNELIELAQKNHAYVGMLILSYQLKQSSTTLDATILLENFLNVLEYPKKTKDDFFLLFKCLSAVPFIYMTVIMVILLPLLLMSPVLLPWLFLGASALPLLLIYYFDNPFSMSRCYQEMANMEQAVAISVLTGALLSFSAVLPMLPVLTGVLMVTSVVVVGAGLMLHSHILNNKHVQLCEYQPKLASEYRNNLKSMFNAENPEPIIQELRNIKL